MIYKSMVFMVKNISNCCIAGQMKIYCLRNMKANLPTFKLYIIFAYSVNSQAL